MWKAQRGGIGTEKKRKKKKKIGKCENKAQRGSFTEKKIDLMCNGVTKPQYKERSRASVPENKPKVKNPEKIPVGQKASLPTGRGR
jgi:hypothetical protein